MKQNTVKKGQPEKSKKFYYNLTHNYKLIWLPVIIILLIILVMIGLHNIYSHQVDHILTGHAYQISISNGGNNGVFQKKQILVFGKGSKKGHVDFVPSQDTAYSIKNNQNDNFDFYAAPDYCTYTAGKNYLNIYDNPLNGKKFLDFSLTEAKVQNGTITGQVKWRDSTGEFGIDTIKLTKMY